VSVLRDRGSQVFGCANRFVVLQILATERKPEKWIVAPGGEHCLESVDDCHVGTKAIVDAMIDRFPLLS